MPHSHSHCSGDPTFNEVYGGAYSEFAENLPGVVCKTPPVGRNTASRFAECCSGPVYNITSPTDPDSPAYPVTCAALCQVDPAFDARDEKNPYALSNFWMCLTNGGVQESGEVLCDTFTVPGHPAPTSFSHTPTGVWMTATYSRASFGELEPWPPTIVGAATAAGTVASSTSTSAVTLSTPTSESVSDYSTSTSSGTHAIQSTTGVIASDAAVTSASASASATASPSTSSGNSLGFKRLAKPVLVMAVLALGLFN